MRDAISLAYGARNLPSPLSLRAHSTRGVASSQALFRGVPLEDICVAAGWSSPHTFVKFYNLDVDTAPGSQILSVWTDRMLNLWKRTSRVTRVTLVLWIGNEMLHLLQSSSRCRQSSYRQRNLRSGWRVRQYKLTTWLRQRRRRAISQWIGVILLGFQTSVMQEAFPTRKPQRLVPYSENKGYASNPRRFHSLLSIPSRTNCNPTMCKWKFKHHKIKFPDFCSILLIWHVV